MTHPAATAVPAASRQRLRLAPAPTPTLPYDDELPQRRALWRRHAQVHPSGTQEALALDFVLPSGLPAVPAPWPRLRILGRGAVAATSRTAPADEATARRPEATRWAALIAQAIVEAEVGDRPLSQLVRWTSAEVHDVIALRCSMHGQRRAHVRLGTGRALVASIHVCEVAPDVAEVSATVRRDGRSRALALRLEGVGDAWRCTALTMG